MKFLLALTATLSIAMAQAQVQFNVFGGPQASTAFYKVNAVKQKTSFKFGGQLGAGMKVPFETRLYFAPALFYSYKGYKVDFTQYAFPPDVAATDNNTSFHTIETAFLLQYDFSDKADHLFLKAGPSLDFQVFGTEKFHKNGGLVDRNIPFGYDKYGHYAANALIQLGYEMKNGVFFFAQYTHGLTNLNNADYGPKINHRVFGLSIGKFLGKNSLVADTRNRE